MDAPVNNPDDNVAISSASVVKILLDSETSLVDPSRPNMVHPFPFPVSYPALYLYNGCEAMQRVRGYGSTEATGAHIRCHGPRSSAFPQPRSTRFRSLSRMSLRARGTSTTSGPRPLRLVEASDKNRLCKCCPDPWSPPLPPEQRPG